MEFGSPTPSQHSPVPAAAEIEPNEIPRQHLLLQPALAEPFGDWIDNQLRQLEHELRDYCTRSSVKKSLSR